LHVGGLRLHGQSLESELRRGRRGHLHPVAHERAALGLLHAAPSRRGFDRGEPVQALFQGVLVGVAALYLYTRAVALLGPVQAALFVPLTPIVTGVVDLLWLGEQASLSETVGMAAVIAGMVLCIAAPRN
jgi:drug/metabolite transporter (DMT)-like permease